MSIRIDDHDGVFCLWELQWGTNGDLIEMVSNLEWAFDDHVTVKSDTTLTTPFKSLSTANVQLHQTIEWDLANVFETKLAIAVNNLIYDTIIKGTKHPRASPSIPKHPRASRRIHFETRYSQLLLTALLMN